MFCGLIFIAPHHAISMLDRMNKPSEPPHADALIWKGRRMPLTQPCLIGRAPDNDLVVNDKEVSRRHAMIYPQDTEWWLSDLGSRNGIRMNGIKLTHARRLRDGDEVRIGAQTFSFSFAEGSVPGTAALSGETTEASLDGRHAPTPAQWSAS